MSEWLTNKRILTFFSHPDDEVLGAGGTLAKAVALGSEVHVIIPATGIHSRRNKVSAKERAAALSKLRKDGEKALKVIGVRPQHIYWGDFADNEMDKDTLLAVVHYLEAHIEKIKPDVVFTHHHRCTNIDHRVCYEAVITALRPSPRCHVPIFSGEIPSSTGYLRPLLWEPNVYVELTEALVDRKVAAMELYETEAQPDPHPRSPEVLRALAKVRGSEAGFKWAEAFMLVRGFA